MFALKRLDNDVRTEVVPLPHDFVLYSVASVSNAHVRVDFIASILDVAKNYATQRDNGVGMHTIKQMDQLMKHSCLTRQDKDRTRGAGQGRAGKVRGRAGKKQGRAGRAGQGRPEGQCRDGKGQAKKGRRFLREGQQSIREPEYQRVNQH